MLPHFTFIFSGAMQDGEQSNNPFSKLGSSPKESGTNDGEQQLEPPAEKPAAPDSNNPFRVSDSQPAADPAVAGQVGTSDSQEGTSQEEDSFSKHFGTLPEKNEPTETTAPQQAGSTMADTSGNLEIVGQPVGDGAGHPYSQYLSWQYMVPLLVIAVLGFLGLAFAFRSRKEGRGRNTRSTNQRNAFTAPVAASLKFDEEDESVDNESVDNESADNESADNLDLELSEFLDADDEMALEEEVPALVEAPAPESKSKLAPKSKRRNQFPSGPSGLLKASESDDLNLADAQVAVPNEPVSTPATSQPVTEMAESVAAEEFIDEEEDSMLSSFDRLAAHLDNSRNKMSNMNLELQSIRSELNKKSKDKSANAEKVQKLNQELEDLKNTVKDLHSELQSKDEQINEAHERLTTSKTDLANFREKVLREENSLLDSLNAKINERDLEIDSLKTTVEDANQKLKLTEERPTAEALQEATQKAEEADSELDKTREQLKKSDLELVQARKDLEQSSVELTAAREKLDQVGSELETVRAEAGKAEQAELLEAREKLEKVTAELESARAEAGEANQAERSEDREKLGKVGAELAEAHDQLEKARQEIRARDQQIAGLNAHVGKVVEKAQGYKQLAKKLVTQMESSAGPASGAVGAVASGVVAAGGMESNPTTENLKQAVAELKSEKASNEELRKLLKRRDEELANEIAARDSDKKEFADRLAKVQKEEVAEELREAKSQLGQAMTERDQIRKQLDSAIEELDSEDRSKDLAGPDSIDVTWTKTGPKK